MNSNLLLDRNVMVDIESLSLRPDAAVASIGLAAFDTISGVTATEEIKIDIPQIDGHVSPETFAWWCRQSDAARAATFGQEDDTDRSSPYVAAMAFHDFIERNGGTGKDGALVWANSPSFDLVVLKEWWRRGGNTKPFPVHYRSERDCRTLFDLGKRYGIDTNDCWAGGTDHSAVDDACMQARAVIVILRALSKATDPR